MKNDRYELMYRCHIADAELAYTIEVFGDDLAKTQGYQGLQGFEAIHYYLIQKHSYTLSDVLALSAEQMRLLLTAELAGWRLPTEATKYLQDATRDRRSPAGE